MGNTMDTLKEPLTSKHTDQGAIAVEADVSSEAEGFDRSNTKTDRRGHIIRYAASSMQGWRMTMEDAHLLAPSLTIALTEAGTAPIILEDHALFAVFDGHGGNSTALYACANLLRVFTSRKEMVQYTKLGNDQRWDVPGIKLLKSALEGAFLDLDEELRKKFKRNVADVLATELERRQVGDEGRRAEENAQRQLAPMPIQSNSFEESGVEVPLVFEPSTPRVKLDRSGSTAVAVLLTPTHIICANAGDSRAILVKSGKAFPLSFDHKPTNQIENSRICRAGGEVRMRRVDGDLAVSRGLGDFRFKDNSRLKAVQQKVSSKPDLIVKPRDANADEFIVLACDGVWDVMQSTDCAMAVQAILNEGETDIGLVCEELLDMCLDMESRDNMTACMVAFPACRIMSEESIRKKGKTGVKSLREKRIASRLASGQASQAKIVAQVAVDTLSLSPSKEKRVPQRKEADLDTLQLALSLSNSMTEEVALQQAPSATE